MISMFGRVENIAGKGENAGNHYIFKRLLSCGLLKSGLSGKDLNDGIYL